MLLKQKISIIEGYIGGSIEPPMYAYYEAVANQARPHTCRVLRDETISLINDRRPHESEAVKDYRAKNRRQLTREVYEDFVSALNRVLKNGNIEVKNKSDLLKKWLAESKFTESGRNYDLLSYTFELVLRESLRDPNRLIIAFPYNADNPDVHPDFLEENGGLSKLNDISIDIRVIPYCDIAYVDNHVLVYKGGYRSIKVGKEMRKFPFYYVADSVNWYTLEPEFSKGVSQVGLDGKISGGDELRYNSIIWYQHDTGESLVNFLPGEVEKAKDSFFIESFLRPAFEIGDEVLGRFSDEQAISVKTAHPIPVVQATECRAEGCNGGTIKGKNGSKPTSCKACKGTGQVTLPGPYEAYVMPEGDFSGDTGTKDPIRYVHPGTEIGKQAFEQWQELLLMMKRSVGLDLLEGTANESGKAKEIRLEKLQDRLGRIAFSLFTGTLSNLLYQIECLLQPNESLRQRPVIFYPSRFNLDGSNDLKDAAKTALKSDRFAKSMAYYEDEYRTDPDLIRLKELAFCYAPLLLLTDEEQTDAILKGVYSNEDVLKAHNVEIAIHKIYKDGKLTDKDSDVFKLIDTYLTDRGIIGRSLQIPLLTE